MDKIQRTNISPRNSSNEKSVDSYNFVLDKDIFSNIFEKDIQHVYIYKKAERLAKAIHLVLPAFQGAPALAQRLDAVAIGLIDGAILSPGQARGALSRELLVLSSVLSIARTGSILSIMNIEFIAREAHLLLQEIAIYEEPRLALEAAPSLPQLAKSLAGRTARSQTISVKGERQGIKDSPKGQIDRQELSFKIDKSDRKEAILSFLNSRGPSKIKDISVVLRDMGEKTIQRELAALVLEGRVSREGERRWTTYTSIE